MNKLTERDEAELLRSMRKHVRDVEYERDMSEGMRPSPDPGCIECTAGVTPDKYNTGLCMYHQAQRLIPRLEKT